MTKHAAIQGDYCDLRFVKGRKVAIIHVEIPIEAAGAFVEAFGTPNPATGVPVALARIDPNAKAEPVKAEKPKRQWGELSRAEQAGIACNEKGFWKYLTELQEHTGRAFPITNAIEAASEVRFLCGVDSRADLDKTALARNLWESLHSGYQTWLRAPEVVG